MSNVKNILLHLSLIDSVGPIGVKRLLASLSSHDFCQLYFFKQSDFVSLGLSDNQATKIVDGLADTKILDRELNLIARHNILWVTMVDEDFPSLLKEIYAPPIVLYYQGITCNTYQKSLAIVGSRQAAGYAQAVLQLIIPDLIACGWTIVSGGAHGADTMAHTTTLASNGKTVAVLGSGLLNLYPKSNIRLFERIKSDGGTLVSAFPLTMEPLSGNFPARNRIIAGLSRGCLVVQAGVKSGAGITARYALEQGREVFAVPGLITDPLSAGCHQLLQSGATLVSTAQDIVQQFGEELTISATQVGHVATEIKQHDGEVNRSVSDKDKVIFYCTKKPTNVEDLIKFTNLSLSQLNDILFELHIDGHLTQSPTGLWLSVK